MVIPGNNEIHHAFSRVSLPLLMILPQLGTGSLTPRPIKLRADSIKIILPILKAPFIIIGVITLGNIWRYNILNDEYPAALADKIYVSFLTAKTCALVSLDTSIQVVRPIKREI